MNKASGHGVEKSEADQCARLWQAVIWETLKYALRDPSLPARSDGHFQPREVAEARAWFLSPRSARDFATVCEFAGFDPVKVRAAYLELLTLNGQAVAA